MARATCRGGVNRNQRPDGPGSRPVRTRGCEDQGGGVPAPKDKPRKGYVAHLSHSGRVELRKVQIRE
jgi:hypothetical protein